MQFKLFIFFSGYSYIIKKETGKINYYQYNRFAYQFIKNFLSEFLLYPVSYANV